MAISEMAAVGIELHVQRRKTNWVGHMLLNCCLLEHVIVGKVQGRADEEEYMKSYWNGNVLECERGSTGSHCLENFLWKSRWTCRTTDYPVIE